jgi:hypothetical protein
VFSDADMAGDIDEWRSTTGVLVFLESAPISWLSLKQKVVALSTCEVKYVAAATAACQVVWLRRLLGELTGVEAHPPALMVDNQPAIALAKNPVLHDRSKHINVKFHFLRDNVGGGQIVIEFVETSRQLADILTKSLGRLRFTELKKIIGMEGVLGLTAGLGKELLSNLLLLCMNVRQRQAPKGSLLLHCSRCRGRRRKAPLPHCSHSRDLRQSQPCCHI